MDGNLQILCNPHPPTEVTIDFCQSPESPLSSAPNTPEQPKQKEINIAESSASPIMLDDPAVFYPLSRQTKQQQQQNVGRESRKTRLRAAQAARRVEEHTQPEIRRKPSLYQPPIDDHESIPMDEEMVLGARLSVTSDGVEVNRQRSDLIEDFPSFDEEDDRQRSVHSQAPSIDEAVCTSPTTTVEALSEAGRRAALERESRWDRFERGRSMERTPVMPRRPASLSPLTPSVAQQPENTSTLPKPTTAEPQRTNEPRRTRGELGKPTSRPTKQHSPALESRSPSLPARDERTGERIVPRNARRPLEQEKRPAMDLSKLPSDKVRTTASDDVSSSDETPLVRNGHSSFRDRQNLRQEEKQNQLRSMYGAARQQKAPPSAEVLPQLIVDHQQLQTIGVQALKSVCDGIGSLFVTTAEAPFTTASKTATTTTTTTTTTPNKHKKRSSRRSKHKSSKQEQRSKESAVEMTRKPLSRIMEQTPEPVDDKAQEKWKSEDMDEDSDGEIPPPPPLVVEPSELDNSLAESVEETCTDAGTDTSYSASTEPRADNVTQDDTEGEEDTSLSTIGVPGGSIATASTPESHEIGPAVKAPSISKGSDVFPEAAELDPTEQTTLHDSSVEEMAEFDAHPVDEPEMVVEKQHVSDSHSKTHRGLDALIARNHDEASVASKETVVSERSAEWSLASAIKSRANRDFPSYQSLSEHKKSDPDGNKESPIADHSKATTSSLTNTERGSSFDISEPPALQRLNRSIESIAPEFSAIVPPPKTDTDWPEAFSHQEGIPSDEGSKDPSTTLSPMSEFLAERLRDGRYHVQSQSIPSKEDFFPEDLDCPSYSSGSKGDSDLCETQRQAAADPVASNSLFGSNQCLSNEVLSNGFADSSLDQPITTIHEEPDSIREPQLDALEEQCDSLNTDASESIKQSPSRNNSDTTTDLFNSLDQMVHDLQSIASGRFDSGESHSAATVPSFADALQVDTTSSSAETVDSDISRDFIPPKAGFEGLPYLISAINADPGIAKGDLLISLLNNDSCRVMDAMSRCRFLRQYSDVDWLEKKASRPQPGFSVLFDVDENKEAGGINDLHVLEQALSQSLKFDEFDRALELSSDINQIYQVHEQNIRDDANLLEKFQLYKATASYNLGIVHLLRGDIEEALTCHETAVRMQTGCEDVTDSEYATLLNKSAACRFAAGDFVGAFTEMEEALLLAREELYSLDDYRQLAEILNNLGCLSYIGGKVDRAAMYFNESLSVHEKVKSKSMYLGARFSSHTAILNASITQANLGFLLLVTQKPAESVGKLEESLRDQEILLFGAHVTIISTMDHLIVANLLAGRKKAASELLRKVYNILAEAFGHGSEQCIATKRKIFALEMKGGAADVSTTTFEPEDQPSKNSDGEPNNGTSKKDKINGMKPKPKVNRKSSRGRKKSKSRHPYQRSEC